MEFTNENRNRYYGLRVGDIVKPLYSVGMQFGQCKVIQLIPMDNNSVLLESIAGKKFEWVAEWCAIVTKVEDIQIEKEQWNSGKNGGCVVSNIIPQRTSYKDSDFEKEKEYYGGYLIAESIPDNQKLKLIAAAPELLEEHKENLKFIEFVCDKISSGEIKLWSDKMQLAYERLSKTTEVIKKATEY